MSILSHARGELERIKFGEEDTRIMMELLEKFLDRWDSGGAVWAVAPVFQRLLAGKPLSPLTGEPDEWMEVKTASIGEDPAIWRNLRCSSVFKQARGEAGHIEAYNLDTPGQPTITFPYWPGEDRVLAPIIEVECRDEAAALSIGEPVPSTGSIV